MSDAEDKIAKMTWNPMESLAQPKRSQFRFTDAAGTQQFILYCSDNGVDLRKLIEHAFFYEDAVQALPAAVTDIDKATQFGNMLQSPANTIFAAVLNDQQAAGVNALDEIIKAHIAERMGEHGQRAAHRQLEGLRSCKKPRSMKCFEWQVTFKTANDMVEHLPGPEAALADETFRRAYLDSFNRKWIERFEQTKTTDMGDTTIAAITAFMTELEQSAAASQRENERKQKENASKKRSSEDSKRTARIPRKKFSPSSNTSKDKVKLLGPPKDEEQCRLHPYHKHTWGECHCNPKNTNKKPASFTKKSGKSGEDNHMVIDIEDKEEAPTETGESLTLPTVVALPDDSHHLDCFALHMLETNVQPLIPTLPMSRMTTSAKPCFSSSRKLQEQFSISGTKDTFASASRQSMDVDSTAVEQLTEELFSSEPTATTYERGSSDNTVIGNPKLDAIPMTVLISSRINGIVSKRPLKVLLDSGSTSNFVYPDCLPKACKTKKLQDAVEVTLLKGTASVDQCVDLQDVVLSEFSHTKHIDSVPCYVAPGSSNYDVIIGRRTLRALGIQLDFDTDSVKWMDKILPMKPPIDQPRLTRFRQMQQLFLASFEDQADELAPNGLESNHFTSIKIKESKYDQHDVDEVADLQRHLPPEHRQQLKHLLRKYTKLFSGKLGSYPNRKMHLHVEKQDIHKLRYQRPYPVPTVNHEVFKSELDRLVELGVLTRLDHLVPFAAPTFIVPKKDGRVRWVSDFRELNKIIKRRVHPLPHINQILRKRKGYNYFTKLDISMQYYTFELDDESKELCTISTPFGNYRYNRAPMGVKQTPDFAQQIMEEVLRDISEIEAYIDDVGVFGDSTFEKHLEVLDKVLTRLQEANFTINPLKCEWAVKETDFLGFWLTPIGLKPWKKKIQAILDLEPPKTVSEVRSFIGAVTFYREMFPKRSHVLAPLYQLTESKRKGRFEWTPDCQQAFDQVKAMLAKDVFIRYPDANKPFHVYTDASDTQLGAVIMQEGKPVAYFSRKLTSAQRNYTVMEKELLSIVTTLNEYRTMLYGVRELHVHTDHKNLTYANLNSQRVLRWRLFLEEFNPTFHYIEGKSNTLADALSRLSSKEGQSGSSPNTTTSQQLPQNVTRADNSEAMLAEMSGTPDEFSYSILVDDEELLECFLSFPEVTPEQPFALDFTNIANAQQQEELNQLCTAHPEHYTQEVMAHGSPPLVVHRAFPDAQPRIQIPDAMLDTIVRFYHMTMTHVGATRLYQTMAQFWIHKDLKATAENIALQCDTCQKSKLPGRGYGHLPPREAFVAPWHEIAVDLIGPWTLHDEDGNSHTFTALTVIDTVTTYCEVILLRNKTAAHVALQLENQWLSRYPRPARCVFDQGNEFLGEAFQATLRRHGIHPAGSTVKNPQSNAVCERLHQSIANALRALNFSHPPRNEAEASERIESALQTAAYAARTALHSTMKLSPGSIAFHRDMILNIPLIVDFELLRQRRQALIDKSLLRANAKRIDHDYQPGEQALKIATDTAKLDSKFTGPFPIERVHTNGTVVLRLTDHVTERINIRRIKPYRV